MSKIEVFAFASEAEKRRVELREKVIEIGAALAETLSAIDSYRFEDAALSASRAAAAEPTLSEIALQLIDLEIISPIFESTRDSRV